MAKFSRILVLVASLFGTFLSPAVSAQKRKDAKDQAGLISDVNGTCWIKRGSEHERKITRRSDGGTVLRVGDKVRCDQDSSLLLELVNMRTTIEPSSRSDWTTIRRMSVMREDELSGPLDDWFEAAAALRSSPGIIYSSPSGSNGAVWPQRFVVRWIPPKGVESVWISIRDESGRQLWPADSRKGMPVPAALGELTSEDARHALSEYQKNGGRAPLVLLLVDSKGNEHDVEFSVITVHDEEILTRKLQACSDSGGMMQFICRAYYFRQLRLYTESADEYDSALKRAPESVDIRLHAIVAQRATGNNTRERELTGDLPPGAKPPE
jgi:hypothetical protein